MTTPPVRLRRVIGWGEDLLGEKAKLEREKTELRNALLATQKMLNTMVLLKKKVSEATKLKLLKQVNDTLAKTE